MSSEYLNSQVVVHLRLAQLLKTGPVLLFSSADLHLIEPTLRELQVRTDWPRITAAVTYSAVRDDRPRWCRGWQIKCSPISVFSKHFLY